MNELPRTTDIQPEASGITPYRIQSETTSHPVGSSALQAERDLPGQPSTAGLEQSKRKVTNSIEGGTGTSMTASAKKGPPVESAETSDAGTIPVTDRSDVVIFEKYDKQAPEAAQVIDRESPEYTDKLRALRAWGETERERIMKENPTLSSGEIRFKWLGEMQKKTKEIDPGIIIYD